MSELSDQDWAKVSSHTARASSVAPEQATTERMLTRARAELGKSNTRPFRAKVLVSLVLVSCAAALIGWAVATTML